VILTGVAFVRTRANQVRIQQYRRIETLEAGQHAPVRVVHDALRVLVGTRAQQHADHDIILRPGQVFA
jgi:hypothetical protein